MNQELRAIRTAHSYLVTGGDIGTRVQRAQEIASEILDKEIDFSIEKPDVFVIDEESSIKISQVRDLKNSLRLKPFSSTHKIVFIKEADKLTLAAQNALLKTLEEPPKDSIIIMSAPNTELLLKTILSRCQIVKLVTKTKDVFSDENVLKKALQETLRIIKANPGERLQIVETTSQTRDKALEFIDTQLFTWRKIIHRRFLEEEKPGKKQILSIQEIVDTTKKVQQARDMIGQQANHKLVIDNLLLSYPKYKNYESRIEN